MAIETVGRRRRSSATSEEVNRALVDPGTPPKRVTTDFHRNILRRPGAVSESELRQARHPHDVANCPIHRRC